MAWIFNPVSPRRESVRGRIEKHMEGDCRHTHIISHRIQPLEQVNLQRVLDKWLEESKGSQLFGYSYSQFSFEKNLSHLVQTDEPVAPLEREHCSTSATETLDCVTRGLFLLHYRSSPIVIMVQKGDRLLHAQPSLELMAKQRTVAQEAFNDLLASANRASIFKGKCVSLEKEQPFGQAIKVRFHEWLSVNRDAIVLPDDLMQVLERNVLGMLQNADKLAKSGWGSRHGVLLHGAPGTGKTLVVRYGSSEKICNTTTEIQTSKEARIAGHFREFGFG